MAINNYSSYELNLNPVSCYLLVCSAAFWLFIATVYSECRDQECKESLFPFISINSFLTLLGCGLSISKTDNYSVGPGTASSPLILYSYTDYRTLGIEQEPVQPKASEDHVVKIEAAIPVSPRTPRLT